MTKSIANQSKIFQTNPDKRDKCLPQILSKKQKKNF